MDNINKVDDEQKARFEELIAADADGGLSIEELDAVSAGLGVSSLFCAACPVSSFSSVSN
jgi:hypothetical protein